MLLKLFRFFLIGLNYFVAKNPHLHLYADNNLNNALPLFKYAIDSRASGRHIYISPFQGVVTELTQAGYPCIYKNSFRFYWLALRAGVYVVSSTIGQIDNQLSRGAFVLNVWHGITIKHVGLHAVKDPAKRKKKAEYFKKINMMPVTSTLMQDYFSSAFGLSKEQTPVLGEPRNDCLVKSISNPDRRYLNRFFPEPLDSYNKVILYMPTWRDYGSWNPAINWQALNTLCSAHNSVLIIKAHPSDKAFTAISEQSHIKNLPDSLEWTDAFQMLCGADILISDYSSVSYEFLLTNRPVILYTPDYDQYIHSRELWTNYDSMAPAPVDVTSSELEARLCYFLEGGTIDERYHTVKQRLHAILDASSCSKILDALMQAKQHHFSIS